MEELVTKIQNDFLEHRVLEVFVLDENGNPMEIFAGPSEELTPSLLEETLAMPGCFYVFRLLTLAQTSNYHLKLTSSYPQCLQHRGYRREVRR